MKIGNMNKLVSIQQSYITKDAAGGQVVSWSDFAEVWAHIPESESMAMQESFAVGRETSIANVNITIRYTEGVTNDMRIAYGNSYYDILGVANVGQRSRFQMLACVRGKGSL